MVSVDHESTTARSRVIHYPELSFDLMSSFSVIGKSEIKILFDIAERYGAELPRMMLIVDGNSKSNLQSSSSRWGIFGIFTDQWWSDTVDVVDSGRTSCPWELF